MYCKTTYGIIEEQCESAELGSYRSYGIVASCGEQTECVHDVTTDRGYALELAETFNRNGLSILHLYEVLEDMLG